MATVAVHENNLKNTYRLSHYKHKNWCHQDGNRKAKNISYRNLKKTDLINTSYRNPATNTDTLYCFCIDLDFDKANSKWMKNGQLCWDKIGTALREKHPDIEKYIFAAVRSSGGKGIALAFVISPLELTPSTEKQQKIARQVQFSIHNLLNILEMGSDPGAMGLDRDMCNWRNKSRVIGGNFDALNLVQRTREPVLTTMLTYLRSLPELQYKKKRDDKTLLYFHATTEQGLAKLYLNLLDHFIETNELTKAETMASLGRVTGITQDTLRKIRSIKLPWLTMEDCGPDGWELHFNPDQQLTLRAKTLAKTPPSPAPKKLATTLTAPENTHSLRNEWIWNLAARFKFFGTQKSEAMDAIKHLVSQIPNFQASRNCRAYFKIVSNIYKNKPWNFGRNEGEIEYIPVWARGLVEHANKFMKAEGRPSDPLAVTPLCSNHGSQIPTVDRLKTNVPLTKKPTFEIDSGVSTKPANGMGDKDYFRSLMQAGRSVFSLVSGELWANFEKNPGDSIARVSAMLKKSGLKIPPKKDTSTVLNRVLKLKV